MANQIQTVRNPPPRMLTATETLHSLNHWKTSFRTYYRRDTFFKAFLLPEARWNSLDLNYGQVEDTVGTSTTRSAVDKCEDLKDFLNTLSGYLPFPYLTEKIVTGSRNLQNVWDTIYDHYGICVSSESLLDYASINLNDGETYRQLYDRLLSHTRLHLPKANIELDGISTGETGEKMTIGMMNLVAIDWLRKINPQLIDIVKVEYSRELREDVQLASLVPRIANNIDAMLNRHNVVGDISSLQINDSSAVDKINRIKHGKNYSKSDNSRNRSFNPVKRSKSFCPECHYLSKKLKLNVNFSHNPIDCPRSKAEINLLLHNDQQCFRLVLGYK